MTEPREGTGPSRQSLAERVSDALRTTTEFGSALSAAARMVREAFALDGVALDVQRDGRTHRGLDGRIGVVAAYDSSDADAEVRVLVSPPRELPADLLLVLRLSIAARFLAESAHVDALTGVANRRAFDERLAAEWRRARRDGSPLSIALLDLDYFKLYNDRRGHQAGDEALRRVALGIATVMHRPGDLVARYGGEEFVALFPGTTLEGAIARCEEMRAAVTALGLAHPPGKGGRLTVSIGVAAARPADGGEPAALIAQADRELYRAKAMGRNRVVASGYERVDASGEHLPRPLATLIGREIDAAEVTAALARGRIVTVSGPAGIGKTRLALAVAHDVADAFDVRFVDVAGAPGAEDVRDRVAAALGIAADDAPVALARWSEPVLLVMDGCEGSAASCVALFAALGPGLRVLATSRLPLGAPGEDVVHLRPLNATAARALFIDRAAEAGAIVDETDPDVGLLLQRLGGSPLAVEIVARRLASAPVAGVLREVQRSRRDASELGGIGISVLIEDAVAALAGEQGTLLTAVASFAGSFTAEDAAAVAGDAVAEPRRADELLRALAQNSLLEATSYDGVTRWRTIGPVRAAARRGDAATLAAQADAAHLAWCRARLEEAGSNAVVGLTLSALVQSEALIHEVRCALDRAVARDDLLESGAHLCIVAVRQSFAARHASEGRTRCEAFIARGEGLPAALLARLHTSAARLTFLDGDLQAAESHARAADALLGDADSTSRCSVLNYLGIIAKTRGDYVAAREIHEAAYAMSRRLAFGAAEAIARGALASLDNDVSLSFEAAVEGFGESIELLVAAGDEHNATVMRANLVEALCGAGRHAEAARLAKQVLAEARALGDGVPLRHILTLSALAGVLRGAPSDAARDLSEAIALNAAETDWLVYSLLEIGARVAVALGEAALGARLYGASDAYSVAHAMAELPIVAHWRADPLARIEATLGAAGAAAERAAGRERRYEATLAELQALLSSQ